MYIKQISVFVENRPGRLADITEVLASNDIDIRALSIADTTDYGVLRLIVDKPDKAVEVLKQADIMVSATQVLGIRIPNQPGGFACAVRALADRGIGIEYAYAFITLDGKNACDIIRVENNDEAAEALNAAGIDLITAEEAFGK